MVLLIIEDDDWTKSVLIKILKDHVPEVLHVSHVASLKAATEYMIKQIPDIIWCGTTVWELGIVSCLNKIKGLLPYIIVSGIQSNSWFTAYSLPVVSYVKKPLEINVVIEAMASAKEYLSDKNMIVRTKEKDENKNSLIGLPQMGGIQIVRIRDIIYLRSEGSKTYIYLSYKAERVVSRSLNEYEHILPKNMFVRVHKQYLVNMTFVKSIEGAKRLFIIINDVRIPVSYRKKNKVLKFLKIKT